MTATSGQYSASLDVVYEEAPAEEGRRQVMSMQMAMPFISSLPRI